MEKIRKNLEIEVEAIVTSFNGLLLYRLKHGKRINNGDCCIQKW